MRIRSVVPSFFSDIDMASLTRDERLLYVGTWSVADDEGLLEWDPAVIRQQVFPYDQDLDDEKVAAMMRTLSDAQFVHTYTSRRSKRAKTYGWIVMFRRHQHPNRPQDGRAPAPPLEDPIVVTRYCQRDGWQCRVCRGPAPTVFLAGPGGGEAVLASSLSRDQGQHLYPSRIQLVHTECAKGLHPLVVAPDPGQPDVHSRSVVVGSVGQRLLPDLGRNGRGGNEPLLGQATESGLQGTNRLTTFSNLGHPQSTLLTFLGSPQSRSFTKTPPEADDYPPVANDCLPTGEYERAGEAQRGNDRLPDEQAEGDQGAPQSTSLTSPQSDPEQLPAPGPSTALDGDERADDTDLNQAFEAMVDALRPGGSSVPSRWRRTFEDLISADGWSPAQVLLAVSVIKANPSAYQAISSPHSLRNSMGELLRDATSPPGGKGRRRTSRARSTGAGEGAAVVALRQGIGPVKTGPGRAGPPAVGGYTTNDGL